MIYSLSTNHASIKAIEKAGFYYKGDLNRFNFNYENNFKFKIYKEISEDLEIIWKNNDKENVSTSFFKK